MKIEDTTYEETPFRLRTRENPGNEEERTHANRTSNPPIDERSRRERTLRLHQKPRISR